MSLKHLALGLAPAIVAAMGCAQAQEGDGDGDGSGADAGDAGPGVDASCGDQCDRDEDGVPDAGDQCPNTPRGERVNQVGCADSQVSPTLNPTFPPYGLTFSPLGDLGRAGGLTWRYTGIRRADRFHIYWLICDDPALTCGLSLDGAIDAPAEQWQLSAADSDLAGGRLVFTNITRIRLADATTPQLNGRLTLTITGDNDAVVPFAPVGGLGVTGRAATHGAEISGMEFEVTALAEVQVPATTTWTPYLDYYDVASTPDTGATTAVSFGGWFYDE